MNFYEFSNLTIKKTVKLISKKISNFTPMKINKKLDNLLRKQGYIKVPLEVYNSGHIVLQLKLNGINSKFLLDTGASGTVLTKECIEQFNLKVEETEESGTGAGSTNLEMQKTTNNVLSFQSLRIENLDFFIMDLKHVNDSFKEIGNELIDAVLGADILISRNCVIDYKGLNLYII